MNRLTKTWIAAVMSMVLIGATLASVVLAATTITETEPMAPPEALRISDADVDPVFDRAEEAAAAALNLSPAQLRNLLAAGNSLKQVADRQAVDYASVARAVDGAVTDTLEPSLHDGSLSEQRAESVRGAVRAWIDAGGQADGEWFGEPA